MRRLERIGREGVENCLLVATEVPPTDDIRLIVALRLDTGRPGAAAAQTTGGWRALRLAREDCVAAAAGADPRLRERTEALGLEEGAGLRAWVTEAAVEELRRRGATPGEQQEMAWVLDKAAEARGAASRLQARARGVIQRRLVAVEAFDASAGAWRYGRAGSRPSSRTD